MSVSGNISEFVGQREGWLVLVGIGSVAAGFVLASHTLVVFSREMYLYSALYIALQVMGWTALIQWFVRR